MMSNKIRCIFLSLLLTACGGGNGSETRPAASRDILIEFEYAVGDIQSLNIVGYRVYADNKMICESAAPYQMYIDESDCDQGSLSALQRPFVISMTALSNNGHEQESAHSAGYLIN